MRLSDVIAFMMGDELGPDAVPEVRPGDKFCRFERRQGEWIYVEVTGLDDGDLPQGCVYASAFCRNVPSGRSGYCRLDELHLRLDDEAWEVVRRHGWAAPGVALGLDGAGAAEPASCSAAVRAAGPSA